MIGTLPHCCSQYCFYQQPSFSSPPPSCKSKSRLGFNDGHSWSLGQAPLTAGGALLAPFPTTLSRLLWDPYPLPILSGGAALKHPARHPSPHTAPCRSVTPPPFPTSTTLLCALFVQGRSDPSLCRLNLHTKAQCKNRQLCGYESTVHPKPAHAPTLHGSVRAQAPRCYSQTCEMCTAPLKLTLAER